MSTAQGTSLIRAIESSEMHTAVMPFGRGEVIVRVRNLGSLWTTKSNGPLNSRKAFCNTCWQCGDRGPRAIGREARNVASHGGMAECPRYL